MDAQTSTTASTAPASGGTVEPVNRATGAKDKVRTPKADPSERYELRDPFAETTHRSDSFAEIVAKAEQLGSTRITALAPDGKRTPMIKSGGEWHRAAQLPALPQRPIDLVKDEPVRSPSRTPSSSRDRPTEIVQGETAKVSRVHADADRAARVAELEAALKERYVIKRALVTIGQVNIGHTEYRFRGDTSRIAFTESTFKLATDTNSPSVARSMVDVAQARGWAGVRVAGSDDFRRLVWLEASVRGVKAIGYEPNPADLDVLKRERDARQRNRIEPVREPATSSTPAPPEKSSTRGSGRKAVLAAMEAVLVEQRVPKAKREAVLAAAADQLTQRASAGQPTRLKVYDKAAPSQRSVVAPIREVGQTRERAAPTHMR